MFISIGHPTSAPSKDLGTSFFWVYQSLQQLHFQGFLPSSLSNLVEAPPNLSLSSSASIHERLLYATSISVFFPTKIYIKIFKNTGKVTAGLSLFS